MITAPSSTANMFFEKKSFFYWLDDGIVEISLESSKKGKWKTMDDNLSAEGKFCPPNWSAEGTVFKIGLMIFFRGKTL